MNISLEQLAEQFTENHTKNLMARTITPPLGRIVLGPRAEEGPPSQYKPSPVEQMPEYWLGMLAALVDLEQSGKMTRGELIQQIRVTVKQMRLHARV